MVYQEPTQSLALSRPARALPRFISLISILFWPFSLKQIFHILTSTNPVTVTPKSTSPHASPPYVQLPTSPFGCAHTIPPTSSQMDFMSLQATLASFSERHHSPEVQSYGIILNSSSVVLSPATCQDFICIISVQ